MCPACVAAALLYLAGPTSAGGIAALVLKSARATRGSEKSRARSGPAGNPQRRGEPGRTGSWPARFVAPRLPRTTVC